MFLCKDPATTVNDHFDQLQEYTSHLEHYKSELTKDKDLKELIFHACTAIEKEFHTNTSKQPIHKVLKTITGWVQSERGQLADGGPGAPSIPTGPCHDPKSAGVIARNKGKGRAIRRSRVTVDTESDDDEDDPDKVVVYSDSDTESIKMVIDEEASRAGRFLKFSKTRSSDVVTGDKCKEPYKATSQRFISKDGAHACKCAKLSFPLPSAQEYFPCGSHGIREQCPASALELVSVFANDKGAAPSVHALCKSYKGSAMGHFMVERSEHLAKLESALMGDVLVLQHTLYTAEKQHAFLLNELEHVQSALHLLVPALADSGDPAPVETETPFAPSTSSNVEPPSA
ncbi:uncharacterized protein BT62DRAFT_919224 [Guyanagaster necrorhizus]|uniref:Uncharacterized protein n=1 Tax=Guyanagaster necrorhizus TaxID=856835 RepID=A0A9P7VW91_9AGAR|nr:uncharacterized protein BT62DRAFT_919224 [Guyanagaster necrorhizus MCA 3950]KAG7447314.1 hypothetical protein BT62DRAFT_919224 [Guyanagaster necrorhizus MCA 3950]